MSGSGSKIRRKLQSESVDLWMKMDACLSEEEFLPLFRRSEEINKLLGYPSRSYSNLAEFKSLRSSSHITPSAQVGMEVRNTDIVGETSNLQSVSWYLSQLTQRIQTYNFKAQDEMFHEANAAKSAIDSLISLVAKDSKVANGAKNK